jgi:hypothetical protein
VGAIGQFPNDIERAHVIVRVTLMPVAIDAYFPSKTVCELNRPIAEHGLCKAWKLVKLICVDVAKHAGVLSLMKLAPAKN